MLSPAELERYARHIVLQDVGGPGQAKLQQAAVLVSGADGLQDIRRIVAAAPAHLAAGGWLLLEHGWDQAAAVRALLSGAGFGQVQSRHDLAGVERCTGGQRGAADCY